jgi:hypothetical protein
MERIMAEIDEEAASDVAALQRLTQLPEGAVLQEEEAERLARLLVEAQQELEREQAAAKRRVARAAEKLQKFIYVFLPRLQSYARAALKGAKKKSIILGGAVLGFRTHPERTVTENLDALTKWAEVELIEAVTYTPRVSLTTVGEWEKKNGRLAPGRASQEETEVFSVRAATAKE